MVVQFSIIFIAALFATAAAADELSTAAQNALKASDPAGAIKLATEALGSSKVVPNDARMLHAIRGQAYLAEKEYDLAAHDLTAAIGMGSSPTDVCALIGDVFLLRGKSQIGLFKYRDAIDDMKAATVCEPTSPETWTNLGNSYFGALEAADAIKAYDEALRLSPTYEEALLQRGKNFENARMYDRALADYAAVLNQDPANAGIYNNRATIFVGMGRFDDAIADLSKAIELDPSNMLQFINRAYAYYYDKKYELAQVDLDQAKKLHDDPVKEESLEKEAGPVFVKRQEYEMAELQELLDNRPK